MRLDSICLITVIVSGSTSDSMMRWRAGRSQHLSGKRLFSTAWNWRDGAKVCFRTNFRASTTRTPRRYYVPFDEFLDKYMQSKVKTRFAVLLGSHDVWPLLPWWSASGKSSAYSSMANLPLWAVLCCANTPLFFPNLEHLWNIRFRRGTAWVDWGFNVNFSGDSLGRLLFWCQSLCKSVRAKRLRPCAMRSFHVFCMWRLPSYIPNVRKK